MEAHRAIDDPASPNVCYQLTAFGQEVTRHSLDLHAGILVAVCARFDLLWHGRIAAAYIQAAQDCFLRAPSTPTCGLHPDQISAGHKAGDSRPLSVLHTAVDTYLGSVVENSVPDATIFSGRWVNKIHDTINRGMASSSGDKPAGQLTADLAAQLRDAPNWEEVVTFAVAWAFPDYVAIDLGDGRFRISIKTLFSLTHKQIKDESRSNCQVFAINYYFVFCWEGLTLKYPQDRASKHKRSPS